MKALTTELSTDLVVGSVLGDEKLPRPCTRAVNGRTSYRHRDMGARAIERILTARGAVAE